MHLLSMMLVVTVFTDLLLMMSWLSRSRMFVGLSTKVRRSKGREQVMLLVVGLRVLIVPTGHLEHFYYIYVKLGLQRTLQV
jgi:hypothetical protein